MTTKPTQPLITIEITINPLQAAILAKALTLGSYEMDIKSDLPDTLSDILDKARKTVESISNCSGTTVRTWLAPQEI